MAEHLGVAVRTALIRDAGRLEIFAAVLDALGREARCVMFEDLHWADEATLDLLAYLGRRIERSRTLLLLSYRDAEISPLHPLRRVLGALPGAARISLAPLSRDAVRELAGTLAVDAAAVHRVSGGNPFFATELLALGDAAGVPPTVRDAVQARAARLPAAALKVLEAAAVMGYRIEPARLAVMIDSDTTTIEQCLAAGVLREAGTTLEFRHELARQTVLDSLSALRRQQLHGRALQALRAAPGIHLARLAHHAEAAQDSEAVLEFAPRAARQAAALGAHREAARHYRSALQQAGSVDDDERQRWLEAYAAECLDVDWHDEAIATRQQLDTSYRRSGDTTGEARNLSRLALLHVFKMCNAQADAASRRAIELLETLPPGPALAAAYGTEASLRMLNRDCADSAAWGRKAIALARTFDDRERLCASLSTLGTALMFIDCDSGCRQLEEALQMALAEAMPIQAVNAMLNLGSGSGELMHLDAAEHELDASLRYCSAWLALCELHTGRWSDAAQSASDVVAHARTSAIARVMALVALGRLRLRRGDPGVDAALDEALLLASAADTLQRAAPVRAARAEAACERGDLIAAATEAQAALPLALRQRHPWFIGELAFWCWRAGALDAAPADCAEPYALQIAGHWREAAAAWQRCPFEAARALADGDSGAQQEALALFDRLGAMPACEALRRRLRDAGVRGLARGLSRGPRPSSRAHPHGLTTRELQVLTLLCSGLRYAQIAQRLSRSVRTVDHHLAAVFAKLGVDSRVAAIQAAQRAGLETPAGPAGPLRQSGQSGQPATPK